MRLPDGRIGRIGRYQTMTKSSSSSTNVTYTTSRSTSTRTNTTVTRSSTSSTRTSTVVSGEKRDTAPVNIAQFLWSSSHSFNTYTTLNVTKTTFNFYGDKYTYTTIDDVTTTNSFSTSKKNYDTTMFSHDERFSWYSTKLGSTSSTHYESKDTTIITIDGSSTRTFSNYHDHWETYTYTSRMITTKSATSSRRVEPPITSTSYRTYSHTTSSGNIGQVTLTQNQGTTTQVGGAYGPNPGQSTTGIQVGTQTVQTGTMTTGVQGGGGSYTYQISRTYVVVTSTTRYNTTTTKTGTKTGTKVITKNVSTTRSSSTRTNSVSRSTRSGSYISTSNNFNM